jgi:hypothetical protein
MNTNMIANKVVVWCRNFFAISDDVSIKFRLDIYKDIDCWGISEQIDDKTYSVIVSTDQSLRDFVATIVHEMIHVKQWETGVWDGDGEAEAGRLQYPVTDRIWSEGVL